jgi:urease accessory protein
VSLFRSLPIAREVCRSGALAPAAASYARDTITLGWEERLKARARRQSDQGHEFATALPRGTVLRDGDCFVLDELQVVIVVIEQHEPVLIVRPGSAREWGVFAYHIGNSHQPLMVTDDALVCADLPGMKQVLEQHAIEYHADVRPFAPVTLAIGHRHTG